MVLVKKYHLAPTPLIPNSPLPLLHYPALLLPALQTSRSPALHIFDLYTSHAWHPQWIFRYGPTQQAHYHSRAHECMVVLSGTATIRFGAADTSSDPSVHAACEPGGVELPAAEGDVFVVPAGVAHKTFNASPEGGFELLSPGDGHRIAAEEKGRLEGIELRGFVMMGAYPRGGEWDFATGGEDEGRYEAVWAVERPGLDPVLGDDEQGLRGEWKYIDGDSRSFKIIGLTMHASGNMGQSARKGMLPTDIKSGNVSIYPCDHTLGGFAVDRLEDTEDSIKLSAGTRDG